MPLNLRKYLIATIPRPLMENYAPSRSISVVSGPPRNRVSAVQQWLLFGAFTFMVLFMPFGSLFIIGQRAKKRNAPKEEVQEEPQPVEDQPPPSPPPPAK